MRAGPKAQGIAEGGAEGNRGRIFSGAHAATVGGPALGSAAVRLIYVACCALSLVRYHPRPAIDAAQTTEFPCPFGALVGGGICFTF